MVLSSEMSDEEPDTGTLFTEPGNYYEPAPTATTVRFSLRDGTALQLRLVGHNPLWGHHLWNGARALAAYLQEPPQRSLLAGATVLELGAGAGLPGLVAAVMGAARVMLTDYPDAELVANLRHNIQHAASRDLGTIAAAVGYRWGAAPLLELQQLKDFRVLLLADVNFNHSEHGALADTVALMLSRTDLDARAWIFFTPYRPWLLDKDLDLFRVLAERGLRVEKILERKMDKVMFEDDPGDAELRRTVFGYVARWPKEDEGAGWEDGVSLA